MNVEYRLPGELLAGIAETVNNHRIGMNDISLYIKNKEKIIDGIKKGFIIEMGLLQQIFRLLARGNIGEGSDNTLYFPIIIK
jgi:hypothetical protein